jgi:hypothetical protein
MQSLLNQTESDSSPWQDIAPLLDVAMARLGEKNHSAIVLRFLEGKDLKQVNGHCRRAGQGSGGFWSNINPRQRTMETRGMRRRPCCH